MESITFFIYLLIHFCVSLFIFELLTKNEIKNVKPFIPFDNKLGGLENKVYVEVWSDTINNESGAIISYSKDYSPFVFYDRPITRKQYGIAKLLMALCPPMLLWVISPRFKYLRF
jgi:hypothetical protein